MVSEIAGTTRDLIEEQTVIDGVRFRFIDTAGIRATDDRLERMGIERTRAGIARARIVVRLVDATTLAPADSARTEAAANPPHTHSATAAGDNTAAAGTHVNAAADNIATAAISDTHNALRRGARAHPKERQPPPPVTHTKTGPRCGFPSPSSRCGPNSGCSRWSTSSTCAPG